MNPALAEVKIIYVLGGLWYQWIAPAWVSIWSIVMGILNSQIFILLRVVGALLVQGVIWLILGYMVYASGRRVEQI